MTPFRLTLVLAATLITACSGPQPSDAQLPDRLAVIEGLRQIDVCALYADANSVDGQPLTVTGFSSALNCDATIENSAGPVEATIALNIGPAQPGREEPSWVHHRLQCRRARRSTARSSCVVVMRTGRQLPG